MEEKIEKILKNSYTNFGEFDESKAIKELLILFDVNECSHTAKDEDENLFPICEKCGVEYISGV